MHVKVIPPGAQVFDDPVVQMVKMASGGRGLRGEDLRRFVKRAGSELADRIRSLEMAPGEVPVHMLAIGATEWFGPNRNGDGFKEAACLKHHKTFEKHALWYHNHANKDPRKSYGVVKLAYYNRPMHRVELVVGLNGTKEAADRNGGLVAEKELEKLARGEDLGVSMSCRVPFDVCSVCGNRARSRDEYCRGLDEGGSCPGGGLYTKIATVLDDGTQVFAHNDDPDFFDISWVPRGADRTAFTTGLVEPSFAKLASAGRLGGSALAEALGVTVPTHLLLENADRRTKAAHALLTKLAAAERLVAEAAASPWNYAFSPSVQPDFDWAVDGDPKAAFTALAREKVAMPLGAFLALAAGGPVPRAAVDAVRGRLPGVYGRLVADPEKAASVMSAYAPSPGRSVPAAVAAWAKKASAYSLDPASARRRVTRGSLHHDPVSAVCQPAVKAAASAESLAREYALYKAAVLAYLENSLADDFDLTCELAVRQHCL